MTIVDEFRNQPQRVLDRLVDGELGPQERRELLASLDDEPGAWRSCALAFLEAQSWRLQMTRVASEPILAQVSIPARRDYRTHSRHWPLWLAMAASMFMAFAIGTRFPLGTVATQLAPTEVTQRNDSPEDIAETPLADANDKPPSQEIADKPSEVPQTLTLTPLGSDNSSPIELPIIESGEGSELTAAGQSALLSRSLVQQFEHDGFEVNRQQRYWPVELPDGRRVVVPIEEVNIQAPQVERL